MTYTKSLIPIKDLHPTELENIKSSTKIFEAHIRERLRYKDYNGLAALMDIKRTNEYFDGDIIKGIIFDNDNKALEIIMLGLIKYTPHYYTMDNTMLGYLAKKLVQKPDLKNLEKLLQETSKTQLDISSLDLFKHLREEEDLDDIIKANMFGKPSMEIKVKIAKAFVAAIHKQSQAMHSHKEAMYNHSVAIYNHSTTICRNETMVNQNKVMLEQSKVIYEQSKVQYEQSKAMYIQSKSLYVRDEATYNQSKAIYEQNEAIYKQSESIYKNYQQSESVHKLHCSDLRETTYRQSEATFNQSTTKLTSVHLLELSHYLNREEFYKFIKDEGIDLSRFDIKFEHYDLETTGTLLTQATEVQTIEDIMLQETYSNSSNLSNIRQIYRELFADKNPYVRDTMTMLVLGAVERDGIKIFFSNNQTAESYYSPYSNMIEVGLTRLASDRCLSIPSVTIHEAGHYAYFALYGSHGTPLDFKTLKNVITFDFHKMNYMLDEDYYGYTGIRNALNIQDNAKITFTNLVSRIVSQVNLTAIDQAFLQLQEYEEGVKFFLLHALKLLQIEGADKELNGYLDTEKFIEWIKANAAALDLFLINSVHKYYEKGRDFNHSHSVYINAQYSYQQGLGTQQGKGECPTNASAFHSKSVLEALSDFKSHVFEPLVKSYALTAQQVCFLERVSDFVNRHSSNFDKENGPGSNDLGIYQELVVRCPEFVSLKLNNELIDSACKEVFSYHDEYIAPDIRARVDNYRSNCAALNALNIDHNEVSFEVITSLGINTTSDPLMGTLTSDASINGVCSVAKRHCDIFFHWYDE